MNGIELSDGLPETYIKKAAKLGFHEKELRGGLKSYPHSQRKDVRMEAERVVSYLKKTVLPKVKGGDRIPIPSKPLPLNPLASILRYFTRGTGDVFFLKLAYLLLTIFGFHLTFVRFWYI